MGNTSLKNRFYDEKRETKNWEERKSELSLRFLSIFKHAFTHSKAYREIYDSAGIKPGDIKSIDDIEKLPILRIQDLVERQQNDVPFGGFDTVPHEEYGRIYINPGLIWQPGESRYKDRSWAEALCGAGIKKGDRIVNTFNYHMWPLAFMLDESARAIGATVIPTGVGNTLMQVRIMQMARVTGFMGTPSFLMTLAQRAEGIGLKPRSDLFLETALVGAEMLPESLRSRIEESLDVVVRQVYGTVFLGCIGYECFHKTGLHTSDSVLVEVVDPQTGKQQDPGVMGEVVATNFNDTYPMIRMSTGDLSMLKQSSCPCGRTSPTLANILGRIDQALKVRGTFVHTWQTDEVVSRHPEVYKYQVVITREEHKDIMTFIVELKEEAPRPEMIRGRLERDIKDILTVKGTVRIVPRGTIPDLHKKIEDRRSWD